MTQRKDLVTWDHSTSFNQPAKVIRAKSEVVERQDGRGTPRVSKIHLPNIPDGLEMNQCNQFLRG